MNLFRNFRGQIVDLVEALISANELPSGLDCSRISAEPPRDPSHGDLSTNAAMVLAKPAGMKPRDLATVICDRMSGLNSVLSAEVAGPGFINVRFSDAFWQQQLSTILEAGIDYGQSDFGQRQRINVEYVSANPTGPLHVAHARGAVVGDALVNLLRKAGYDVTSEYYINDAGAQVDQLGRSAHLRYREALGEDIGEIPEGLYPGEYMIRIGRELSDKFGDTYVGAPETEWLPAFRDFAIDRLLVQIKEDLAAIGIEQDVFTSERALVDAGKVDDVFSALDSRGLIYQGVLEPPKGKAAPEDWEPREQTLFRATDFGDDIDRPLKKSDGSWTYFSNDIANHLDKFERGFPKMIDIWGADHGGYVKRMAAAVNAVTEGQGELDVKLCQMVHLKKGGQPFRMSKRAGNFITLRDLIDELGDNGKDVVRFIMLTRKNDTQMDFDLDKSVEQSRDNPVFYVQYAHARCCSVLRNASIDEEQLQTADVSLLNDPAELDVIRELANWPRVIEAAADAHEPHRIAFYMNDVASAFHGLWNKGKDNTRLRFISDDDPDGSKARLALVRGVATVIASGLAVMGVQPLEELR